MSTTILLLSLMLGAPAAATPGNDALATAFSAARQALHASRGEVGLPREEPPATAPLPPCELPALPAGAWRDILAKACADGEYRPEDAPIIPATYGLAHIRGPREQSHKADYLNLWGGVYPDGVFRPWQASLVSEDWVIAADGNWHIDRWVFTPGLDGSIEYASHGVLVETLDGTVLDMSSERLAPGDPAVKAKLEALIVLWTGFVP